MQYRTRRRSLIALSRFAAYRGPGLRDDTGDTGDANPGGGGGNTDAGDKGAGDGGKTPKITGEYDPDRAARALAAARDGEAKAKQAAKDAQAQRQADRDALAVALGLKPDPKVDPTQLVSAAAKERDDARAQAKARTVELAVYKAAGKAGADADALLDSRTFLNQLDGLDPSAGDFADKVGEAIKAAVKANAKLATGPAAPGKSGAEITGGTGAGQQITEDQLKNMTPEAIDKALKAGQLAHLL